MLNGNICEVFLSLLLVCIFGAGPNKKN